MCVELSSGGEAPVVAISLEAGPAATPPDPLLALSFCAWGKRRQESQTYKRRTGGGRGRQGTGASNREEVGGCGGKWSCVLRRRSTSALSSVLSHMSMREGDDCGYLEEEN